MARRVTLRPAAPAAPRGPGGRGQVDLRDGKARGDEKLTIEKEGSCVIS